MGPWQELPAWAQELADHLNEGESALFILHGQVFDYVRVNGDYLPFRHFLGQWLAQSRQVVFYNLGLGLEFGDAVVEHAFRQALEPPTQGLAPGEEDEEDVSRVRARALRALGQQPQEKPFPQSPREVLQLAERVMTAPCRQAGLPQPLALVLEYAETIVPAVDLGSMGEADRAALVTLLRWARQRELVEAGHVIILTTGNLAELNGNLRLSRHGAQIIEVPPPDQDARLHFIEHIRASGPCQLELTSQGLANLAAGLSLQVVRSLLNRSRHAPLTREMVRRQKKDLLRQELVGLIEVIEPRFGLEEIGGLEPIKGYFAQIVRAMNRGDHKLVPRGITMMGPPGVGKTALAEALARDIGFNFVKLLNPRTKWVGESERNFFKALSSLRSLTPLVVVEDEADQSEHGRDEYSGDTGVSNRLRQMRFEFTGDPAIQGKVLWIRITNRPDRLDQADLRSGPFQRANPLLHAGFHRKVSHFPGGGQAESHCLRLRGFCRHYPPPGGAAPGDYYRGGHRGAGLPGLPPGAPGGPGPGASRGLPPSDRRLSAAPPDRGPAPHGTPGPEPVLLPALRAGAGLGLGRGRRRGGGGRMS